MALAVDAVSTMTGTGVGPFTWSHTCSGSNRVLKVDVMYYESGDTISALTYNGVSMTVIPSSTVSNGQYTVTSYSLVAPATGSNTVSLTFTGSVFECSAGAISWTGADQSTPLGTAVTATGSSTTPSVTASSASGEVVADALIIVHSGTLSVDGSQTQRWNAIGNAGFTKYAGSTEDGAASVPMSWSNSTSQDWAISAVPVKPVITASGIRQLSSTGVGT